MGAGRLSRSELFAEVFGGSTGPNMVSSEFGDLMVAPASEDKVSAPKVFEDETSTPDVFEENVSRRDQILKSIDSQLAKIDSIESANKDPWSREMDRKSRNTYYFDTSVPISIPELHPEQKKLEAARVELRAARKNAEAYNETDYADGERKGGAKPFYERLADGLTNSTQDDMARMLTMGWYGLDDKKRANDALNKSANGARLTEAEQSILDAFSLNTDATQYKADHGGATAWGNIGEGIPGTVEFMLGLAATGGSLGVTSKIISTGILKGAGKIASREAVRTLATSGPLNNLAERANSQFRIDETGAAEKYNPQNFTAMLIKSYLSSYAENFSEQVGNLIPKGVLGAGFNALAPKLLGSKIAGQVGNGIGSLADNTKKFRDVLQKTTNWNGTVGEFLEEEFNNIVEPIITLEPERMKDNFSVKNQLTTLGSVAVFGGAMHALSAPSIAMDIARTGSMNKRVNGALGNIENEEFRKGVFQAVKRGTSIEDKATKLSDLNWADVSAADRANAVDAFTWNTNLEVYKGLQQQEDIQQETTTKINEYNNWFKTNANEQSGNIEEIETEAGDRYRLRSGTLEGAGVDGTVFARNIATGEIEQLGVGSIKSSPKAYGYEEGLKQILTEFGESSATAMAEAESAELEADAQRAGVPTDFYTLGDDVQLSDGSVVGFLKYHNDGSGLAEVYKIDPETLEQVSFEVKTSQITGAFVQPEQTEQPEQIVPNQELQTPHIDTPEALPGLAETPSPGEISAQQEAQNEEEVIPRQKDGTPDYDAMPPEMFFNEYSKVFSQDEALEILNEELSATRNQVLALEKKAPSMTSRNEKILNKRASSKLQAKERELLALIESKRQALNTANTPVQSASVSDAVRQRYEQAPKEFGIEKSIIAPNDEVIPGRYVLIESGSVTPSHDPITFAPSAGFPTTESGSTVNDRDYSKDKDAQKQVITMAQKYNGRAIDNPVVITPDGVVISGNNRTMSGDLAAANGTDSAYLQHLTDNAAQYGFAKEQIKQFKHPRIVFEAATPQPYNTETFAKFNAQETKTQNKVEKAVKIGKTINPKVIRQVSSIIDEYENLGDLYADTNSVNRIVKTLIDNGIINQNKVAELMDGDNLSGTGKDTLETLLVGAVLSEDAVRLVNRDGMKQYRNKITRAILPVLDNATFGEYSIAPEVSEAIKLLDTARHQRSTVDNAIRSQDMFSPTNYSQVSISIAKALEGSDKGVKQLFNDYNSRASSAANGQMDLITGSVPTKPQILHDMGLSLHQEQSVEPREQTATQVPTGDRQTLPKKNVSDPIAMAQTPEQKLAAVTEYVNKLNELSGSNAQVFTDINELPADLIPHLIPNSETNFEADGIAFKEVAYIYAPLMHDEQTAKRTYIHEVAGRINVEKAISRSEHKMFFEAVVDHIGLDAMLDLQISELAEEVGKFNNGVITKMQLGREYVAYLTENYFAVDDFSRKSEELFINLSNPLTNDVIGQILKSTNNGTGKIGIIPRRAARIRIVSSPNGILSTRDVNRSRTRSADTALPEASDGSRMGDAEANAGGADQQRGLEDSLGSDNDSISRQNQSGTDRDQQADRTRQTESDGFTEQAGDTGIGGANETKIVTDSDVRNLSGPRLGETNTIVTADRIEELRRRAKEKLKQLNSGFDPELFAILTELSAGYIEAGVRRFSDFTNRMVSELGDNVRPYLASMYEGARRFPGMEKISKEMDSTIYVDNYTQEHAGDTGIAGTNKTKINTDSDVRNLSGHSQRNSTVGANEIQVNEDALLDADRRRGGQVGTKVPSRDRNNDGQRSGGESSSVLPATVSGKRSNNKVSSQDRAERRTSGVDARGVDVERAGMDNTRGDNDNNRTRDADDNEASAEDGTSFRERTERAKIEQKKAEVVPVALMDMNNIRQTLPLLLPEQQDDVMKAETRFYSEKHKTAKLSFGKGMMFTNGTGTGKTFTGFGIIKRFYKLGKKDILIIVPAEAKIKDWTNEAKLFGLDVHTLESIKDRGKGISVTTFANFRANNAIKDRELDLIVYDECHRLMESNKGDYSSTTRTHFQMCNRNLADATIRIKSVHPLWLEEGEVKSRIKSHLQSETDMPNEVAKLEKRLEEIRERQAKIDSQIEEQAQKAVEKTKVVYLSATPFKSYFNLRYANGTLFNWDGGEHVRNGSRIDSESAFMLDNFGSNFEWKSHRLQAKSGSNAEAIAMQEVEFADKLMESGVMSSRAIESNMDYSREFPLITLGRADVFNQGFNDIFTFSADAKFGSISEFARKVFYDYNYSTQLYESLRAYMSINRIKQHIDLGRKVVVFHRRKQANATPPFRSTLNLARNEANKILSENFVSNHERMKAEKILAECNLFENEHQELLNYEQSLDYSSAIDQITKAFGTEKVVTINGDTPKSSKSKNIDLFNSDTSKVDIIVIQEEAGKEGISLHDKTGKHQRVLMNMSLPISSTTALQIEGRIYRIGQESNAIFEYPLLGLDMEIANFGQTINRKLSTTENLATGSQARDLIRSFAEGVLNNSSYETPNLNQGIGGKEYDKRNSADVSAFHKAVLVYQTNQRNRTRRDQRDGTDFYATPEPVGFKMVEMLNLKTGNSVLEPSAGDGRIAMWFPESSNSTIIEPSHALFSKASVRAGGGNRKSINSSFEDFNIINKFDGIAMNPPFGQGGATAIAHIEKAFTHLKDNGRIVAIVPRGSMDKKLDNFLYGEDAKGKRKNPNAHLIASINLPASTFEQAGTSVATQIVIIDKISSDSTPDALKIDLSRVQNIQELFSAIENLVVPERGGALNIDENTIQENAESQFELFKQKHSKTGEELYTVEPKIFLANNWNAVLALAKKGGGYYSSYSNKADNVRSGFIFKSREDAEAFLSAADNILDDQDIRYRESSFNGELTQEMEQIKDEAIQRGDYMMAPNGEPSNLNENQWLQVRTTAFKKWFGDWGKAARIGKLRSSETVKITGKEVIPSEDMKEYRRNALEYGKSFKGEYINQDTGISILVSNVGLDKLLSHDKQNIPHIQSIAAIPQLIENSVFITELQPGKDNHKFDSYKYFVSGLNINGEDYTIKIVVGEKNGNRYYDHSLTEIEKGELLSKIDALSIAFNANNSPETSEIRNLVPLSDIKDKRLVSILQTNSSKVVDANGEPMVVYHGTRRDFNSFNTSNKAATGIGSFFTDNIDSAKQYAGNIDNRFAKSKVFEVFLNMRNPFNYDNAQHLTDFKENYIAKKNNSGPDLQLERDYLELNYDGEVRYDRANGDSHYIAFNPNQIKSATENTGDFSSQDNDIRYRPITEINDQFNSQLQQLIDGMLPADHIFELGMPSDALLLSGVPNLPIELSASRLKAKSEQDNHKFDLSNVTNLPEAIASPIAVFDSKTQQESKVVLTEISNGEKNFVVAIRVGGTMQTKYGKSYVLEVNDVRSLYPRDAVQIMNWINDGGLLKFVNKEKALEFIKKQQFNSAEVIDKVKGFKSAVNNRSGIQQFNSAEDAMPNNSFLATKVIENFENPTYESRHRIDDILAQETQLQSEYEQNKEQHYINPTKRKSRAKEQLQKLSKEFGVETMIVDSVRDLPDNLRYATKNKRFSGFYHKPSGKVYFISDQIKDADDATATFMHEVVSHKGIDGLMGQTRADQFYTAVFNSLNSYDQERFLAKYGSPFIAGDEVVARMAEGDVTPGIMQRVIAAIRRFFREQIGVPLTIKDNDIRYILWKSKNNLQRATSVKEVFSFIERDRSLTSRLYPKNITLFDKIANDAQQRKPDDAVRFKMKHTPFRVAGNKKTFNDKISGKNKSFKEKITYTKEAIKEAAIQTQEALQDATIKVKALQNHVVKRGGTITPSTNLYEALNHCDSIAKSKMDKYDKHHIVPVVDFITGLKRKDIDYSDFTKYMLAKHSIERHDSGVNALNENEDGSWTREVTEEIVNEIEQKLSTIELDRFWNLWRKATNRVLDTATESGRMGLDTRSKIQKHNWEYYVPLRGKDFDFEGEVDYNDIFYYNHSLSSGKKLDSKNADIKARGRRSKAADPIAALQHMANLEFYLSSVNDARRNLLRLVQQNSQMKDLFEMKERWYIKVGESWTEVDDRPAKEEIIKSNIARRAIRDYENKLTKESSSDQIEELQNAIIKEKDNIAVTRHEVETTGYTGAPKTAGHVVVMKDGMKYVVVLKDPEVAQAIDNTTGTVQRWLSKYPGRATRVMAQLLTSKNPAFLAPNLIRDMQQAAMYNMVDSDGNTSGFLKHAMTSWPVLSRNLTGNAKPLTIAEIDVRDLLNANDRNKLIEQYGKDRVNDTLYELFSMNGGETGYVHIIDPKEYERKLEKAIKTRSGSNHINKAAKAINNGIDYFANITENSVRYATFMSQIERGASVFDAVTYAKNITVNFNRKGKYSKGIGALFMFFNAGIQSIQNGYSLWGNKNGKSPEVMRAQRARFIAGHASLAAAGYVSAELMWNLLSGLMGDDGEELQISDYERRTNLIIPMVGTAMGYLKIPIPISFRPFYSLGVMTSDWVNGRIEAADVMASSLDIMTDSTSPIPIDYSIQDGDAKSLLKPFIPSIIKPLTDIAVYNQNFIGQPINREAYYNPNTPDSQLGQRNANKIAVAVSEFLNKAGGGNKLTPAGLDANGQKDIRNWLDISPSTLEYIPVQYTGGIGRLINEIYHTLTDSNKDVRKIPILNRFYGTAYERDPSKEYFSIKRNVEWVNNNIRDTEKLGVSNTLFPADELQSRKQEFATYKIKLKRSEKQINAVERRMKEAQFGSDEYNALETEIDKLQRKFIKEYNDDKRN